MGLQGTAAIVGIAELTPEKKPSGPELFSIEQWAQLEVVEACPFDLLGRFLIRDNDRIYGTEFRDRVDGLGLRQIRTAFRSPWQNGFAERWISSLRRDCLDHGVPQSTEQRLCWAGKELMMT
jgi:hypothetical protein